MTSRPATAAPMPMPALAPVLSVDDDPDSAAAVVGVVESLVCGSNEEEAADDDDAVLVGQVGSPDARRTMGPHAKADRPFVAWATVVPPVMSRVVVAAAAAVPPVGVDIS